MIFEIKKKRRRKIPDFPHDSPTRITPIVVTFYLLLNIKNVLSILGIPVYKIVRQ